MTPKTVTIAVAIAVGGVLLGMNYPIAEAQRDGPYGLSAIDSGAVWRMDRRTGQVSICFPEGEDVEDIILLCSVWGPVAER